MTENNAQFLTRRMQEEMKKAGEADQPYLRNLHLGWAALYERRLRNEPRTH